MKITATITAAFALVGSTALAVPLDKLDLNGVYVCNDRKFAGYCSFFLSKSGVCVQLGSDLNDQVSSLSPNSLCYFYVNANCSDSGDFFHFGPGNIVDLSQTPVNGPPGSTRNFEDKLSSYKCYTNT